MKIRTRIRQIMAMLAVLLATGIVASCEKAENLYTSYVAYFKYNPVSAKPNLYRACTSLGEFCSITYPPGTNFVIKSPSTPSAVDYIPFTALQGYQGIRLGVGNGLIIGMPTIPEMLAQESKVTCYDLCCPNCYHDNNIQKHLQLYMGGMAECISCNRTYDMNNMGIVTKGETGRSLFRYHVNYYAPTQTVTVNNR